MRVKIDIPNNVFQLPTLSAELLPDTIFEDVSKWRIWNTEPSTPSGILAEKDARASAQITALSVPTAIYVLTLDVAELPDGRSLRLFTSDADGMRQKLSKPITRAGEAIFAIDPGLTGVVRAGFICDSNSGPISIRSMSAKLVSALPEFAYHEIDDIILVERNSVGTGISSLGILTEYTANRARFDFGTGIRKLLKEDAVINLNTQDDWFVTDGSVLNKVTSILGPDFKPVAAECNFLNSTVEIPTLQWFTNLESTETFSANFWIKASNGHVGHKLRFVLGATEHTITLTANWQNIKQTAQVKKGHEIKIISDPADNVDANAVVFALSHVMINKGAQSSYVETSREAEKFYWRPLAYRLLQMHGLGEFTLSGFDPADVEDEEII